MLGHSHGVAYGLGYLSKERGHLVRAAQIKLFRRIVHAVRVAEMGLGADANQRVMRVGMGALQVMNIVGSNEIEVKLLGPRNQLGIDLGLFVETVVL